MSAEGRAVRASLALACSRYRQGNPRACRRSCALPGRRSGSCPPAAHAEGSAGRASTARRLLLRSRAAGGSQVMRSLPHARGAKNPSVDEASAFLREPLSALLAVNGRSLGHAIAVIEARSAGTGNTDPARRARAGISSKISNHPSTPLSERALRISSRFDFGMRL